VKSKLVSEQNQRTYVLAFERGDEVLSELKRFARQTNLVSSSFKAIGALSDVTVGWFNWESKQYQPAAVIQEQIEVLSLIGDIALHNTVPEVHAHIVVGKKDGTAHGGHLSEAHVRPTLEVVLTESPEYLKKEYDAESGLALLRP
jgi:predicted DNA-binding protein with PD1-like motif